MDKKKVKLLVVVDMQKDFVTGCLGSEKADSITPAVAEYIRNFEGDIVVTKDTHGRVGASNEENAQQYLSTQEGRRLPVPHCLVGTPGHALDDRIEKALGSRLGSSEMFTVSRTDIFCKPSFGSMDFAEFIKKREKFDDIEYSEIQFCGVCTGICVISNAVIAKAAVPEADIKILANMCACVTDETHLTALKAMQTLQMDVVNAVGLGEDKDGRGMYELVAADM